jgi:hypothetical protein
MIFQMNPELFLVLWFREKNMRLIRVEKFLTQKKCQGLQKFFKKKFCNWDFHEIFIVKAYNYKELGIQLGMWTD